MSTAVALPWLTDDELNELCAPLVAPAARIRYLKRLGLHVERKPNGRPLLMRSELERVLGAGRMQPTPQPAAPAAEPDMAALLQVLSRRKSAKPRRG
ncbi:hypothetical protein [Aquabacterium sp. OR-4]|uniref:hypothetical protein n=1 Tax=Aquabacterium sp. OR-4 TaxID=2978127 RepID=UPI0021B26DA8|nr:hypothetical protein [Aquabacterium sp. OR-4]MDT7836625.1 hypothetical protein [Aquabacterium sp. OR-4]